MDTYRFKTILLQNLFLVGSFIVSRLYNLIDSVLLLLEDLWCPLS